MSNSTISKVATGKPNYFFGLQITELLIQNQFKQIQLDLENSCKYIKKDLIKPNKFHITLFVMELEDDQLPIIKSTLLPQAKLLANEIFGDNIQPSSTLKGLGSFNDRVIWAGIDKTNENSLKLIEFRNGLYKLFKDQQIKVEIDREWSPHITLARGDNISKNFKILKKHLTNNSQKEFGIQNYTSLQLMKIGSTDNITKYFNIEDSFEFNK